MGQRSNETNIAVVMGRKIWYLYTLVLLLAKMAKVAVAINKAPVRQGSRHSRPKHRCTYVCLRWDVVLLRS